jgi:hypothetical protein
MSRGSHLHHRDPLHVLPDLGLQGEDPLKEIFATEVACVAVRRAHGPPHSLNILLPPGGCAVASCRAPEEGARIASKRGRSASDA